VNWCVVLRPSFVGVLRAEATERRTPTTNEARRTTNETTMDPITAFETLDLRVGRVLEASVNAKARKPSYVLKVDFGAELGIKTSSAQLTVHYRPEELVGRQVVAAVNLGSRNIAGVLSEVLVLGLPDPEGSVILLTPEREVPLGGRVF
jgi:tRNA-binding protein